MMNPYLCSEFEVDQFNNCFNNSLHSVRGVAERCADDTAEDDGAGDLLPAHAEGPAAGSTAGCRSKDCVCIDQPNTGAPWRKTTGGAPANCLPALLKAWYEGVLHLISYSRIKC